MFNKETEYALRGLVYIYGQNSRGRRPGTIEIAKEIEAPPFYTAKILQRMVKQGFLLSAKGKGGGFYFGESMEDLSMKDLILFTEGPKTFMGCGFGLKQCSERNPCPLHEKYSAIRKDLSKMLETVTIRLLSENIH